MKRPLIITVLCFVALTVKAQNLNTFFSQADAFFKAHVADGKVAYAKIDTDPSELNNLLM